MKIQYDPELSSQMDDEAFEALDTPSEERSEARPLVDWPKPPELMTLQEDLTAAKPSHDAHAARIKEWNRLREARKQRKTEPSNTSPFGSPVRKESRTNRSEIEPKLVRRQNEWRYSGLSETFLAADKLFKVKPRTFEDMASARQNELLINWQFRSLMNTVKFIDDYVHAVVDDGTVIVRVGWERHSYMTVKQVPTFDHMQIQTPEEAQALQEVMALRETNPKEYSENVPDELKAAVDYFDESGIPTVAVMSGMTDVQEEVVTRNQPTVEVLNYDNVYIDPSCNGDIEKAKFAVIAFETSQADLRKDGRYKNLDAVNWESASVNTNPELGTRTPLDYNFKDPLRKKVAAYEYWGSHDIDDSGALTPIVVTWVGDQIIRMELNPYPDQKIPLVVVPYMPIRSSLEGEPDAELLGDNQKIQGAILRGIIDLMGRSANSQVGVAKNFLDVTNRRRFEQGRDYEFNPGAGDPRMSIFQHTYPEIPMSALTVLQMQNQDAEALTGVKSFSGGISGEAYGKVAAAMQGMLDASAKREMSILRRLTQGMKEIGDKVMAMNSEFLSDEEVVAITNEQFVTVSRESLVGKHDLLCDIATPETDQAQAEDLGFMLQTIGPNMDAPMRNMILAQIAELKKMPTLAKSIRDYRPEPDPLVVKQQQLEIQKLELEVAELQSRVALNQAKAKNLDADTDATNLDYLETESGTKHERDLQKASEQARSNENLEIMKGILQPSKAGETKPNVEAAVGFKQLSRLGLI